MSLQSLAFASPDNMELALNTSIRSESDEALFIKVARGDEDAFRVLLDRHLPKTLLLATRMLGNATEADDVAQEAMMRVWTRGNLWRPGAARFTTWLHRVTVNLCIDRLRRRTYSPIEVAEHIADSANDPAQNASLTQIKYAVQIALDGLPGKQKAAIMLCHYEGFTGQEAAKILGISVLAVQSLLVRARANLRIALGPFAEKENSHE